MTAKEEEDMESKTARESKLPLMLRVKGTVILKIWNQIAFVILYTTFIVCLHTFVGGMRMNFPQTLIPVLGVVTGLLLVFRTNTAYDRYWEGRRLWSQMTLNIRTLTRCIWVGVKEEGVKDVLEKTSAINLLVAFAYATKNYLREEYSYDEEDLRELISHIPKFATPSSNQPLEHQAGDKEIQTFPQTKRRKSSVCSKPKQFNFTAHDYVTPSNIPIELSYYIASYINSIRIRDLCDGSTISVMNGALTSLVDCLTGFERILRTPIPLAYSVHLHHSIWLYLLALPYQLVGVLNWWTIPAVTLASFSLLGILGIGWEIENPFGYDDNDLPLDDFCKVIRKEIQVIMGHTIPNPESWILSSENHPLSPGSPLTAHELSSKSMKEVRDILAKTAESINCDSSVNKSELRDNFFKVITDAPKNSKTGKNITLDQEEMTNMLNHIGKK